ncbi:hypothetical protein [Paraburkholderia caribensis]|uniref:hypothetical protein n=1 Tax=Paraburkholderia caribensis TaxID=75105 RepID=UPI0012E7DCD2|nr:hypothetical protein [Paraburkholderia caribensis]
MQWKEAFSSLCRWIADVHIELWPIERIIATNPDCELVWAAWTTALEFLRKATLDLYPPPAEYRFDSNPTILKLEWDLTSKQDESAEFFPETALDLNHRHSIRSRGASPAEAKSSYLAVVDHLTDWILSDASDTGGRLLEVQSYITAFSEGRLFRVVGSDHRLVSLAALMFLFEKNAVVGGQHRFRSLRVDADSMLSGHNSRARRQAFLIGLYACLFSAIRRHASLGEDVSVESLVSFRSIYSVPHSTIPGPTPFSGRALSAGIVLCPVVEGLSSMRASDSNDPA